MAQELLNIVNEKGEIIGEAPRDQIHREGLLHREIHVWMYTPKKEIIFQKRAANKDTWPNLLDASVGGHVDLGDNFEDAAVRELEEETGLKVKKEDLKLYKINHSDHADPVTKTRNNALRATYLYCYTGKSSDLKVEDGSATGFEFWPISRLKAMSDEERVRFIPGMVEKCMPLFDKIARGEV